jgi:hypothetical protein
MRKVTAREGRAGCRGRKGQRRPGLHPRKGVKDSDPERGTQREACPERRRKRKSQGAETERRRLAVRLAGAHGAGLARVPARWRRNAGPGGRRNDRRDRALTADRRTKRLRRAGRGRAGRVPAGKGGAGRVARRGKEAEVPGGRGAQAGSREGRRAGASGKTPQLPAPPEPGSGSLDAGPGIAKPDLGGPAGRLPARTPGTRAPAPPGLLPSAARRSGEE